VRPYSKGQKNDFRDAEAIAEALQRRDVGTAARREQRNNANEEELSVM
jgi:transposase